MFDDALKARATALLERCKASEDMIATAESCTGGLVAALLTEIAGSSAVVDRGFVTYSNEAKHDLLSVPLETLVRYGAVSAQTAQAMAVGALVNSRATLAVAITGIAGPGGGSAEKPVGLVHFGLATLCGDLTHVERHFGDIGRENVRRAALEQALTLIEDALHPTP